MIDMYSIVHKYACIDHVLIYFVITWKFFVFCLHLIGKFIPGILLYTPLKLSVYWLPFFMSHLQNYVYNVCIPTSS